MISSERNAPLDEIAQDAFDRVQSDPVGAERDLRAVLADPTASVEARITAAWGLGRALHDRGAMTEACEVYERAVEDAAAHGDRQREAQLRVSWALCLQGRGDHAPALAQLALAEGHLSGVEYGRLLSQRGYLYMFMGRTAEAIADFDRSLTVLERDDPLAAARVFGNRGIARAQRGDVVLARSDFLRAQALADDLGQALLSAGALHNLGWAEARLGNIVAALRLFDQAASAYAELGSPGRLTGALDTDRCEVYLTAGLATEALEVADRLVAQADVSGDALQLGEAMLMRARALLLLGRCDDARAQAVSAADLFRRSERGPWAALADHTAVRAEEALRERQDGSLDRSALHRLRDVAATLHDVGWTAEAAEVRVLAGRVALALDEVEIAAQELRLASAARRAPAARARADGWLAAALLRHRDGDRAGSLRAVAAGLRAVAHHRTTLGATELRARASVHGAALAQLALRIAIDGGDPVEIFGWAERWRAGAVSVAPVARGADQAALVSDLARLRALHAAEREATLAGEMTAADHADAIGATERLIAHRARLADGAGGRSPAPRFAAVSDAVGDATLIEYVECDGELSAIVIHAGRARLAPVGRVADLVAAHDHLLFAIRRLSAFPPGHRASASAVAAFHQAATDVDALALAPLDLDGGPTVVVPTGSLHGVAWGALPSLNGVSVTIAPSAASWLTTQPGAAAPGKRRVVLVGGPDLGASDGELAAIAALHPGAAVLSGAQATVDGALAAIAGADVAHIAAHGEFRADNPMFSSLRLVDGPLCVYDIEGLAEPPRVVVMTACQAGRSGVFAGDELLGTAATLVALGVRSVIAPLLSVPDDATARFAIEVHRALSAGASPAAALARAAQHTRERGDSTALAVAAAFQCIGVRDAGTGAAQRSAMRLR